MMGIGMDKPNDLHPEYRSSTSVQNEAISYRRDPRYPPATTISACPVKIFSAPK